MKTTTETSPVIHDWNREENYEEIQVTLAGQTVRKCNTRATAEKFARSESKKWPNAIYRVLAEFKPTGQRFVIFSAVNGEQTANG